MTAAGRLFALFPAAHLACIGGAAYRLLLEPGLASFGWLAAAVYLAPLLAQRALRLAYPEYPALSHLEARRFSPWWASHQLQTLFIAFPALEAALRLVPGLFSAWLRLWGSRIGRGVYWTPRVSIVDRDLLEVGDFVIFGHKVEVFGHTIKPKSGRLILYVRRVTIGSRSFIGAGSRMAPGVIVAPGSEVPILTDLYPNKRFPSSPSPQEGSEGVKVPEEDHAQSVP